MEERSDIFAIVTDIDMPGSMDGLKLAEAVQDRSPPVHIVTTTGKNIGRNIPLGTHFIAKPCTSERLLNVVGGLNKLHTIDIDDAGHFMPAFGTRKDLVFVRFFEAFGGTAARYRHRARTRRAGQPM